MVSVTERLRPGMNGQAAIPVWVMIDWTQNSSLKEQ